MTFIIYSLLYSLHYLLYFHVLASNYLFTLFLQSYLLNAFICREGHKNSL